MTAPTGARLYRLALTYTLTGDGLLVAERLPADKVPARGEGALYRRLAGLADADDAALVAAASRYGPLGPTQPIRVASQPAYLWAVDGTVRGNVRNLKLLRTWLSHGGATPIPGRVAPVAHALAIMAEADADWTMGRLVELLSEGAIPTDLERATFGRRLDQLEHRMYAGISRRAALMNRDHARGEAHVSVHVQPAARPRLAAVATQWRIVMDKAAELGGLADLVPPGTLGRLATEFRPYLGEGDLPLYPAESVGEWRKACRELAEWVAELSRPDATGPDRRPGLRATLLFRLQSVDAWPYPADELLGAFPRALWSLWEPVTGQRTQRRCAWPDCTRLLPADAHGNRRHCDQHRRQAARDRAARNRRTLAG